MPQSVIPARYDDSPPQSRRGRWLPLWLLLAAAAIPLLGGGGYALRDDVQAWRLLGAARDALRAGDRDGARSRIGELLFLPPAAAKYRLLSLRRWPTKERKWAVQTAYDVLKTFEWNDRYDDSARPGGQEQSLAEAEGNNDIPVGARGGITPEFLLEIDGENADLLYASAYREQNVLGNSRKAAEILEQAVLLLPPGKEKEAERQEALSLLGWCYEEQGEYAKAAACFRRITDKDPSDTSAWNGLAYALARNLQYAEAIDACSERLEYESRQGSQEGQTECLYDRAKYFAKAGRKDLAYKDILAAKLGASQDNLYGDNDDLREYYYTLAYAGHVAQALRELDAALEISPDNVGLYRTKAFVLEEGNKYADAIRVLEQAIGVNPVDAELRNSLAWTLATAADKTVRDPKRALGEAKKAVKLDKMRNAHILDTLAETHYVNREFAEAVKYEKMATRLKGDFYGPSLRRYNLALEQSRSGKEVELTDCPLAESHKLPDPGRDIDIDPAKLRAAPRLYAASYYRCLPGEEQEAAEYRGRRAYVTLDLGLNQAAQYMAQSWKARPETATDDPARDLRMVISALCRYCLIKNHEKITPCEVAFVRALAELSLEGEPERRFAGLVTELRAAAPSGDDPKGRFFARKFTELAFQTFTRQQLAQMMLRLANGEMLLAECCEPAYHLAESQDELSPEEQEKVWGLIKERLLLAASDRKMAPPQFLAKPKSGAQSGKSAEPKQYVPAFVKDNAANEEP